MANINKDKVMLAVESGVDEIVVMPYTLSDVVPKIRKGFAVFHNPKNPEKVYELAKTKLRENKLDEARDVYQSLHESAPKAARPLVGLARVAFAALDLPKAVAHLDAAVANNPNYVHAYSLRGDILSHEKKYDDALKFYRKAVDLSPLNPSRYRAPAQLLLDAERYQEVVDLLEIAVKKQVDFNEIYHFLSQAYYHLKDYKQAVKHIRHAVEKEPENVTYLNQLALSYKESGELEEAKKTYNRVIKLDPDNLQGLFNKAIMLSQTDQREDAIKILKRVIEKYPDFTKAKEKLQALETPSAA
jgi:tetratricopeptide (TPR) repeat protein